MGLVPEKLYSVSIGLNRWYNWIKREKRLSKQILCNRLEKLDELFPSDEVLEELFDVHLALNLEADREELYWE